MILVELIHDRLLNTHKSRLGPGQFFYAFG